MATIITAQDMYDAVLDGLNKNQTGTIFPDEFDLLINEAQLETVVNKYEQAEKTQKRIDDLRTLEIIGEIIVNTGASAPGGEIFALPYNPNVNVVTPKNPSGENKGYLFLLRASFKIQYVNNSCYTGISEWLKSKVMRSDVRDEIARDPFNKPTDERLYHQTTGDTLILFTGGQSFGLSANIDYLRYPRDISVTTSPNVDCELPLHMRKEIVDIAIRKRLELIESQRYPTKVNENRNVIT